MAFCFLFYFFDRFFYHNKETKHNGSGAHNNDNIGIAGFTCFGTFQRRSFFLTFVFWNGKKFECLCINCPALCAGKGFDAFRINRWFRCNTAFIPTMIFCNGFLHNHRPCNVFENRVSAMFQTHEGQLP